MGLAIYVIYHSGLDYSDDYLKNSFGHLDLVLDYFKEYLVTCIPGMILIWIILRFIWALGFRA